MTALLQATSFEKLQTRYLLRAELVAVSGLRVGAGKSFDAAATDQPVMRDALGRPYIPGSSLKGSLRSGLEAVLRGLGREDLWACEIFDDKKICVGGSDADTKRARRGEAIPLEEVLERICTACSLFGSRHLAGRVFVHDLPRLSGSPTEIRDGVGINRDLGVAQPKIKYDVEVIPTGTRFQLEMLLENVDDIRLGLVLQALSLMSRGEILLGGLTSRGLGKVRIENPTLERTSADRLLRGLDFEELDYAAELESSGRRLGALLDGEDSETREEPHA